MKPSETQFKIIVDTREQKPLTDFKRDTVRKKLDTGDYSIEGYEEVITFEHKTIKDLIGTCDVRNRDRFKRELLRMDTYDFYCIVISGNETDVIKQCNKTYRTQYKAYMAKKKNGIKCRPPMRPEVRAKSVFGTLKALRADFNCHYYFFGNKQLASEWVEEQCEYFMRHKGE